METVPQNEQLIKQVLELLEAHRGCFGQERVYQRAKGLALGEYVTFGGHQVSQVLVTMGVEHEPWNAWYRLFSEERFDEGAITAQLFRETLAHVKPNEVYVVGGDGTQVPRDSLKMEGSSWLKCSRNPPFKRSIHRAQQFFHGAWLLPPEKGYSRAVPLRMLPAFTRKAVLHEHGAVKEWEAGQAYLRWVRAQLDAAGRPQQQVLGLFDGSFDTLNWWKNLPEGVNTLVRTARNRDLRELYTGTDRRRKYGPKAPTPGDWLHEKHGWKTRNIQVRRGTRRMTYRVEGPYLRHGASNTPVFLIVVRGERYKHGGKVKYRRFAYYLVNAVQDATGQWVLPLPVETLLFWAWQRWELEVTHREMKTDFGLGDKQCWNPTSAVATVQWSAWVYALLVLAGYRTFGLCGTPPLTTAWWRGARRWSWCRLLDQYRAALFADTKYTPCWPRTATNWWDKEAALRALTGFAPG